MTLASIVIPAYNSATYLPGCLRSALAQTYVDFDVIVVDDGSKDDTRHVVARFLADPRVRYIHQENKGLPGARNTGAKASQAEYLAFLDADDFLAANALEVLIHRFEQERAAWANVGVLKLEGTNRTIRPAIMPDGDLFLAILNDDFITRCPFFRRTDFFDLGMYDEEIRVREDWEMNIRLIASRKPYVCINEPLYHYTRTEGSITTGNRRRILQFTEKVLRKHHKALADAGDRRIAKIYSKNTWELARYYFYEIKDYREAFRCIRESLRYDKSFSRLVHPVIHRLRRTAGIS